MNRRTLGRLAVLPLVLGLGACADSRGPIGPTQLPSGTGSAVQSTSVPPALQGAWQLVSLQVGGQAAVPAPSGHAFTADFGADGRVSLVADCNRCGGGFAASGGTLDVGPMACTLAYCSTAPLDTQYAGLVQSAKQWSVTGSELSLESSAGTMRLRRP